MSTVENPLYLELLKNSKHVQKMVKEEKKKKKANSRTNRSSGIRGSPSQNGIRRTSSRDSAKRATPRTSDPRHTPSRATPRTSDPILSPLQRDSRDSPATIIVPTPTPRHSPRQTQNPLIVANFSDNNAKALEGTQNTAVDQRTMLLQEKRKPFRNTRKYFAEAFRQIGMKKRKEAEKEKKTEIFAPDEEPLFKPKPPGEPIWTKDQDRETEKPVYMRFYSPTRQGFYYKHIKSGLIGWNLLKLRDEVREMGFVGGGKLYKKAKKAKKAKKSKKAKKVKKVKKDKKDKKDKKRKKSKKSKKGKK